MRGRGRGRGRGMVRVRVTVPQPLHELTLAEVVEPGQGEGER